KLDPTSEQKVGPSIEELQNLLEQAIDESRSLTFELSPPVLYQLGLTAALQWLAEEISRRHGLRVRVQDQLPAKTSEEISTELRVLLFQSVRELLSNVVKHAGATQASVTLRLATEAEARHGSAETAASASAIALEVTDNGTGFSLDEAMRPGRGGFGVFSLRTRLEQIGGRLEFDREAGGGTRATVIVSIPPQSSDASADVKIT